MCANMPNWSPFDVSRAEGRRFLLRLQIVGSVVILGSMHTGSDF